TRTQLRHLSSISALFDLCFALFNLWSFVSERWEGFKDFWCERFSFLTNYSKFVKQDKPLPPWSDSDVEAFIALDPVQGPAVLYFLFILLLYPNEKSEINNPKLTHGSPWLAAFLVSWWFILSIRFNFGEFFVDPFPIWFFWASSDVVLISEFVKEKSFIHKIFTTKEREGSGSSDFLGVTLMNFFLVSIQSLVTIAFYWRERERERDCRLGTHIVVDVIFLFG
ncbi:hypothetical protein DVH24_035581, partial [Malus domestica]